LSSASATIFEDSGAESANGTIWSSSPWMISVEPLQVLGQVGLETNENVGLLLA
jgi:hypothetical protein